MTLVWVSKYGVRKDIDVIFMFNDAETSGSYTRCLHDARPISYSPNAGKCPGKTNTEDWHKAMVCVQKFQKMRRRFEEHTYVL